MDADFGNKKTASQNNGTQLHLLRGTTQITFQLFKLIIIFYTNYRILFNNRLKIKCHFDALNASTRQTLLIEFDAQE